MRAASGVSAYMSCPVRRCRNSGMKDSAKGALVVTVALDEFLLDVCFLQKYSLFGYNSRNDGINNHAAFALTLILVGG